jgi:geranylgeranyl diphosphate synthase, type II
MECPSYELSGPVSSRAVESFPSLLSEAGEFLAYADTRRDLIDETLAKILSADGRRPAVLHEAMRYSVLSGGKRLRPLLCGLAAELCGKALEDVLPAACALELIHAQSLIHDDLPAIDNDKVRRGRPTCHVKFGEAAAILAGDALLALAFEVLGQQRGRSPAGAVLDVMDLLSKAIGRDGMAAGEMEDILAEGGPGDLETLEFVHHHKSGDLIRASLLTGAILCGGSDELRDRLAIYGRCIGLAFQIVDDILGEDGDPISTGKPVGRDRERKKLTYPALVGMRAARNAAIDNAQSAINAVEGLGPRAAPLKALGLYVLHRNV